MIVLQQIMSSTTPLLINMVLSCSYDLLINSSALLNNLMICENLHSPMVFAGEIYREFYITRRLLILFLRQIPRCEFLYFAFDAYNCHSMRIVLNSYMSETNDYVVINYDVNIDIITKYEVTIQLRTSY